MIRYEVIRRKGIVRALSGDTRERSPCFTDLSAVTVATAPKIDENPSITHILLEILGMPIYQAIGKSMIHESKRVPSDREYSSIE